MARFEKPSFVACLLIYINIVIGSAVAKYSKLEAICQKVSLKFLNDENGISVEACSDAVMPRDVIKLNLRVGY